MQPTGTVVGLDGKRAVVVITRHSACSGCRACPMGHEASSSVTIKADNHLSAQIGQKVIIDFDSRRSLWAAVIVYIWPLLALFMGYAFIFWVTSSRWPDYAEALGAAGSIAIALLAIWSLRLWEPRLRRSRRLVPVIGAIIDD